MDFLPVAAALANGHPERTVFTRFIRPSVSPSAGHVTATTRGGAGPPASVPSFSLGVTPPARAG
jgi:hypothetical protein